ncbi:MAG: WecB/TagA/CpsF family glycosyltransferase [Aeromicrobium sp.]
MKAITDFTRQVRELLCTSVASVRAMLAVTRFAGPRVGDVSVRHQDAADVVQRITCGTLGGPRHVHFVTAHTVVTARKDPALAHALDSGTCFADGLPLVWALKAIDPTRHWSRNQHVRGTNTFSAVLQGSSGLPDVRHFLLGGSPEVLSQLEATLQTELPGTRVVGSASPPFLPVDQVDWEVYRDAIVTSEATHVWVGLGTPKQDFVAKKLADADPDRLYLAVGAGFDFVAGTTKWAPAWMQRHGLEWVFRLATEPRRLWRRYIYGNSEFLILVFGQFVRSRLTR